MPADTEVLGRSIATDAVVSPPEPASRAPRLQSLDVVRGMAVVGMILVEQTVGPSRAYPVLRHAAWNGWTAADVVFPAFLVVVGMSLAFSLRRPMTRATVRRLARRTLALLAVGLLFNAWAGDGFRFDHLRYPGVLQRIAVVYLIVDVLPRAGWSSVAARVAAWPWAAIGRNALVVYVGQHVLGSMLDATRVHTRDGLWHVTV